MVKYELPAKIVLSLFTVIPLFFRLFHASKQSAIAIHFNASCIGTVFGNAAKHKTVFNA